MKRKERNFKDMIPILLFGSKCGKEKKVFGQKKSSFYASKLGGKARKSSSFLFFYNLFFYSFISFPCQTPKLIVIFFLKKHKS